MNNKKSPTVTPNLVEPLVMTLFDILPSGEVQEESSARPDEYAGGSGDAEIAAGDEFAPMGENPERKPGANRPQNGLTPGETGIERRAMKTRIEYHGTSDSQGRCHFSLHWMADYHPGHPDGEYRTAERGQHFFADPRNYGHQRPEDV